MQMYPPNGYKEECYCEETHQNHHHHHDRVPVMKLGGDYYGSNNFESYKDDRVKSRESWYEKEEYNNGYLDAKKDDKMNGWKLQMNPNKHGGEFEPRHHHHVHSDAYYGNNFETFKDDKIKRRESWYEKEEYANGYWDAKKEGNNIHGVKLHMNPDKHSGSKPQNVVMEGLQEASRVLFDEKVRKPVWNSKAIYD